MKKYNLKNAAPTDGRYSNLCEEINLLFSEYNLIKTRVKVEIEWLIFLSKTESITSLPLFTAQQIKKLRDIYLNFEEKDAARVKKIEETTKHDVKAVEYFIKERISKYSSIKTINEHLHICCTSEDINNIAYAIMILESRYCLYKQANSLNKKIKSLAKKYKNISMLSHTHGQPASPTTLGKEIMNFYKRIELQLNDLMKITIKGKFNGATGNYSAHKVTYPKVNWPNKTKAFLKSLNIEINTHTTQIEPHDYIADICYKINHINSILIGLSQDFWTYISKNYFIQKNIKGEIGSSTMPHKINPINFENAEGNLGMSNALTQFFSHKLTISRLQRDLSDSTVLRNLGLVFSYSIIAYKNLLLGLNKIDANKNAISTDLENCWEILAEPIQMIARKYNISNSYEILKKFTRGKNVDEETIKDIINNLSIPDHEKKSLLSLTPKKYIGYAASLCNE